jgi:Mg/Co/Ni transporter MgtE
VVRGSTVDMAVEALRTDDKAPAALLSTVFVTEEDGHYVGSVSLVDLLRTDRVRKIDELDLTTCTVHGNADVSDVTLMMADYNLSALGVTDSAGNLIGAISADDVIEALVPDDWRARVEASTGV